MRSRFRRGALAASEKLTLADVAGLPFVTADLATDGCEPRAWQDDWLIRPRPGGDVAIIGATARTVDVWCEHVAAGHGIGLCPSSAATFHGRPGVCFIPSAGLTPTTMCVAWRAGDVRTAVQCFVSLATESVAGSYAPHPAAPASAASAIARSSAAVIAPAIPMAPAT